MIVGATGTRTRGRVRTEGDFATGRVGGRATRRRAHMGASKDEPLIANEALPGNIEVGVAGETRALETGLVTV